MEIIIQCLVTFPLLTSIDNDNNALVCDTIHRNVVCYIPALKTCTPLIRDGIQSCPKSLCRRLQQFIESWSRPPLNPNSLF